MVSQVENRALDLDRRLPHTVEGLLQVFTASYRSFFTNVTSQALRIAGQGTPVLVVQFLKGGINQGHDHPICLGQNLEWIRCNIPRCIDAPHLEETEQIALQTLWQHTQSEVRAGKYDLVVLDELSLAIHLGLIAEAEVVALLQERPKSMDMILTGPEMPQSILDIADQVTQLRRIYWP